MNDTRITELVYELIPAYIETWVDQRKDGTTAVLTEQTWNVLR